MPSGGDSILIGAHMNPYGAASPQALFAATGAMAGASYMDAFGNIHQAAAPAVNDPYAAPALFGGAAGTPAAYMYSANTGGPLPGLGGDEIRTVFVSGFPHDVKERELHNLLRFMPGYEASQMNWKTGGPQGFALFSSAVQARAVVELLSGLQFDDGVAIRAEMAHKNMFIKPEDPSVKRASRHSPTLISPTAIMAPVAHLAGNGMAPSPLSPAAPTFMAAAAAAAMNGSPTHHMGVPGILASPVPVRPATFSPVTNLRDNPPCNTLFIGNLGDNTNEQELRALFSSQPGYRQLKMVCGTKSTTAFVEFHDVPSAMMVHATLQGAVLASSDRGGIRVQYSKNPFGRREICASPHTGLSSSSVGGGDDIMGPGSLVGSASPRSGAGGGMHSAASGLLVAGMPPPGAVGQLGQVGSAAGMVGAMIGPAGLDTVLGGNDA